MEAIRLLQGHGHRVVGLFLVGYPGETEESLRHTLEFIQKARPMLSYVWVSYYQPVPSTVGFEQAVKRDPALKPGRSNREITYLDPNLSVGTLVKYRSRMMSAGSPHAIVGFFERNDFRSQAVLRDLLRELGQAAIFVLWHDFDPQSPVSFTAMESYHRLLEEEIIEFIAQTYGVAASRLQAMTRAYPLFFKILLLLYVRRFLELDYCIMTDNDLAALEPLTEIGDLSARRVPFLIQEKGSADNNPAMRQFVASRLGKAVRYRPPSKGGGYNIGLCGIDLTVFDSLDGSQFTELLDHFGQMSEWCRDQLFLVPMIFSSARPVHVFENERYEFLPFDDFSCRQKSKVYHAIFTRDKSGVDLLYSLRYGKLNARRYLAILDYVRACACQRILEIGVCAGDTSELLLLNSRNKSVEYHGIDLFEDADEALRAKEVSLKADALAEVRARLEQVSRKVHLHKGFSHDAAVRMLGQGLRFDMIWIDGGHSYATVRQDFQDCLPLLSEGGVIFFDDYTDDAYLPDVKRFIDQELRADPALVVTVHERYVDRYRGHDYKIVSVTRKTGAAAPNPEPAWACPPGGFYFHLLGCHNPQDLSWEAPYLLAEAQACFERESCLEYARHLLKLAGPFLSAEQLLAAARGMVERGAGLEGALRILDQLEDLDGNAAELRSSGAPGLTPPDQSRKTEAAQPRSRPAALGAPPEPVAAALRAPSPPKNSPGAKQTQPRAGSPPGPPRTLGTLEWLEKAAEGALARNPADVSARIALAELLCGRSDYQRAFVHFHQAFAQAPNNPRLIASLARTCRDLGEEEAFLNLLSRLRKLDPQHVLVRATAPPPERAEDLFQGHRIYEIDH